MPEITNKSEEQKAAEAEVESFRKDLGPFVVAAETTRMAMVFTVAGGRVAGSRGDAERQQKSWRGWAIVTQSGGRAPLFDHLIGEREQVVRDIDPARLGGSWGLGIVMDP